MKETRIDCLHCKGNACIQIDDEEANYRVWLCFGCGFTTSPGCIDENKAYVEEVMPELYKALCFKDKNGLNWYPSSVNIPEKGMVFADGKTEKEWKWSAVPSRKIKLAEKLRFPEGTTHVPNMKKLKQFDEKDYMESLDYIKYFDR